MNTGTTQEERVEQVAAAQSDGQGTETTDSGKKEKLLPLFCCRRRPKQPPYEMNLHLNSNKWVRILGLFPSKMKTKKRRTAGKREGVKLNEELPYHYPYATLGQTKTKSIQKKEKKSIQQKLNTKIHLYTTETKNLSHESSHRHLHENITPFMTLERSFHATGSEKEAVSNLINPSIHIQFQFNELTSLAIDETISIEWTSSPSSIGDTKKRKKISNNKRRKKVKRWYAFKIWTDLFKNGMKVNGIYISSMKNTKRKMNKYPYFQYLINAKNIVVCTLIMYTGPTFHRTNHTIGRIYHLFLGNIQTYEEACNKYMKQLVAIINEQNNTMFVVTETTNTAAADDDAAAAAADDDNDNDDCNILRRGISFMLLRRLGLEIL
jgi:hypothetical protein